jgi:hypothetical protein
LNPGNGHYYEWVSTALTWYDADAAANASSHLGLPGHLVTITSAAENLWITANSPKVVDSPWIGLIQPAGSAEPAGGWTWVTGEPFVFDNWAGGEPNDLGGEEAGHFWPPVDAEGQTWNDLNGTDNRLSYIVEYEAASSVPEAGSTAPYLLAGLLGLMAMKKLRASK